MVQLMMEINQVCSKQLMEHLHLHSDKKIEIAAGGDGNEKDDDITITALKGGILIIANENGSVTIKAQNILL